VTPILWTTTAKTGGKVSITPRPRGGDWLDDEMLALHAAGVDVLISALTDGENRELGLTGEARAAERAGLVFQALPIEDLCTPADSGMFLAALGDLAAQVNAGRQIAVHCRASIGRSGMISALLLSRNGWEPDAAMAHLSELRGTTVPETDEQRRWVLRAGRADSAAARSVDPVP
jgi:protein-tyrosine phosphatase